VYICQPPADCKASVYTRAALVLSSIEFDTKTTRECSHRPAVPVSVFGSAPRRVFASPVEASVTPVSPPVILSRLALCSRGGCDAVLRHRARLCFFCTFSAAAIVGFRRRERGTVLSSDSSFSVGLTRATIFAVDIFQTYGRVISECDRLITA